MIPAKYQSKWSLMGQNLLTFQLDTLASHPQVENISNFNSDIKGFIINWLCGMHDDVRTNNAKIDRGRWRIVLFNTNILDLD